MNINFRPIDQWPGELTHPMQRRIGPFKAGYDKTTRDLERELDHLDARDVVIQLELYESEIRRDGLPYANARPRHPGVILCFNCDKGPLKYPCDTYDTWTSNLRAIVLALQALRAVDRYGVTKRGEQYRGWMKLEAPATWDAAEFIADGTGYSAESVRTNPTARAAAYKLRARVLHPDAGGSDEAMKRLNQAMQAFAVTL